MIGKNKISSYYFLSFTLTIIVLINTFYISNILIFNSFIICSFLAILTTKYGIKFLENYKFLQRIREEGPESHFSKEMTPTMGGIFIIPIFLTIILIINIQSVALKLNLFLTIFGFFSIGLIDDYLSIRNQINLGLKGKEKLILQILFTTIFIIFINSNNLLNPEIQIWNDLIIDAKAWIFPIAFLTIISLSNSVNLADGLDGLAAGCSSIIFCGLGTEILLKNDPNLVMYSFLSFCMCGLCLGFLKYNKHPAKIFMGDTGSLAIGGIMGILCVITNSFFSMLIISGLFVIEALSVILQVTYFKITKKIFKKGKRIFLMTPIHHHFELKGFEEKKIVEIFWIINILLVIFSIVLKASF